jgi:hypothetical protein
MVGQEDQLFCLLHFPDACNADIWQADCKFHHPFELVD